ncbi:MAG: hypothetical protein A2Y40_04480 [Candidatus Margulisbacteria bacterium GWF2_35_9]|nr:MAG: hypothetical protein A2Y40_04480 [Candidatus Margulisbacteria bacterium GWF2_35_9]
MNIYNKKVGTNPNVGSIINTSPVPTKRATNIRKQIAIKSLGDIFFIFFSKKMAAAKVMKEDDK